MSLVSLLLVVLAAFIHATWNLLSKRAADAGPTFVFAYNMFACLVYLPWMIWLLVYGELKWNLPVAICLALSACIHLAYSLCLQRGYQLADLSVVYPVARGTGPMLSSIGAFILLQETPTKKPRGLDGVRWGTATGSLIAGYTVVDGYGVKVLGIHPVVLDWMTNLLRFFIMAPVVFSNWPRAKARMKGHWWLAFWVGALSPLSYILVLTALDMGAPLSLVAPAREMSMMVGAMFGMLILGERVTAWRVAGCAVLIGGVVLLGLARA
jgi:drug/metabolite transporter (DMT)-like permease